MVELADTLVLGTSSYECRFESCYRHNQYLDYNCIRSCGGIGRRIRLKIWWSNPYRFDPGHEYYTKHKEKNHMKRKQTVKHKT